MRNLSDAERAIIADPQGFWEFRFLEVTNYDGTWINLGNLSIGERNTDFLNTWDLADDIDRNTLTFNATLRGSVGEYSLMPFRSDSPLNVDDADAYQPLLDLHREWKLWVCYKARGDFPSGAGDYREEARGIIDRLDISGNRDEIAVQGRGPEADLIDHLILADETTPKVYAEGTLADVLQAMLDDQFPATYTLVVDPSAPSTFINELTLTEPKKFWQLLSDTAAVGTGVVRFLYDDSDVLAIHLFTPNREATGGDEDWILGPNEYEKIDNGLALDTVGNYVIVRFVNEAGSIETVTSPATPVSASIARYGLKPIVITLAADSGINDATRAQAMADAIRADRELPILGQSISGTGLWFGELWDFVGTPANGVTYNEDQAGGVVAYSKHGANGVTDCTYILAGKPKGRYATWLDIGGTVTVADVAPVVTNLTASWKNTLIGADAMVPGVFSAATVNGYALSVQFELSASIDFAVVIATNAVDVVDGTAEYGWVGSGLVTPGTDYYVRATPYSGALSGGSPTGSSGDFVVANTRTLPKPTDTPTLEWDISDPTKLVANVVGGAGVEVGELIGTLAIPIELFQCSIDTQPLQLTTIPTAETEVGAEYRQQSYAVGVGSVRIGVNISAKTGTPSIRGKYSTDNFGSTAALVSFTPAGTGIRYSDWTAMPAGAKADIGVTWYVGDGADTATLDLYRVWLEYLPTTVSGARVHVPAFAAAFN